MNAIIFDFDGTIADSFPLAISIAHELTHHDMFVDPAEVVKLRKMQLVEVAETLGIPKWQWPFLMIRGRRKMAKRLNELKPFQGMPEALSALKGDGYKLFIVSSNSKSNIEKFLTTHGLGGYFLQIYGGVSVLGKARILQKVIKKHSLSPETTAYVGDEARDVRASKKVGMPCVGVTWGFGSSQSLNDAVAMVVVRTPGEMQRVLQEWGNTI